MSQDSATEAQMDSAPPDGLLSLEEAEKLSSEAEVVNMAPAITGVRDAGIQAEEEEESTPPPPVPPPSNRRSMRAQSERTLRSAAPSLQDLPSTPKNKGKATAKRTEPVPAEKDLPTTAAEPSTSRRGVSQKGLPAVHDELAALRAQVSELVNESAKARKANAATTAQFNEAAAMHDGRLDSIETETRKAAEGVTALKTAHNALISTLTAKHKDLSTELASANESIEGIKHSVNQLEGRVIGVERARAAMPLRAASPEAAVLSGHWDGPPTKRLKLGPDTPYPVPTNVNAVPSTSGDRSSSNAIWSGPPSTSAYARGREPSSTPASQQTLALASLPYDGPSRQWSAPVRSKVVRLGPGPWSIAAARAQFETATVSMWHRLRNSTQDGLRNVSADTDPQFVRAEFRTEEMAADFLECWNSQGQKEFYYPRARAVTA